MRWFRFGLIAMAVGAPTFILSPGSSEAPLSGHLTYGVADAEAAVSVLISLEDLVDKSNLAVVATATDRTSRWEEVGGSRRIVTYTRLAIEQSVLGPSDASNGEIWVRTLGGVVDKIGQAVAGEAKFKLGRRSMVFLAQFDGTFVVTALAQGHYPLIEEEGKPVRLASSPDTGKLVSRPGPTISAREQLVGQTLEKAIKRTVAARSTSK